MTDEEWEKARKEAHSAQKKKRYYERKSKGLCVACGAKAAPGRTLCKQCSTKHKEQRLKREMQRSRALNRMLKNRTE